MSNFLDTLGEDSAMTSSTDTSSGSMSPDDGLSSGEKEMLDTVGEALARLGRVKRVGLSVKDKISFIESWSKRK